MTFGSLFSGIGGFDLGLERAGMRCGWQVEIDPFCQRVLAKHWPDVRRYGDIKECHNLPPVDLICGGVPCQPASVAGKQRGTSDDRWLWPEAFRIVREVRPAWLLFENVCGILALESGVVFENLLLELEALGYEVETAIIPACGVDAPHRRDRVWIVAHSKSERDRGEQREFRQEERRQGIALSWDTEQSGQDVADSYRQGSQGWNKRQRSAGEWTAGSSRWPDEADGFPQSAIRRVAHGVPSRVDRLKALGNAVVPQVIETIGRAILKEDECQNFQPQSLK